MSKSLAIALLNLKKYKYIKKIKEKEKNNIFFSFI